MTETIYRKIKKVSPEELEALIKVVISRGENLMIIGEAGGGKTMITNGVCRELGLRMLYRSASTMDAYTDLVGVPRVITNSQAINGDINEETVTEASRIGFIRPSELVDNPPDVIFIDEANRANEQKIMDSVLELCNSKSINGKPVPNLKSVIIAMNPDDGEYVVNTLDKAHLDRFAFKVRLELTPNEKYLVGKHGSVAKTFVDWWGSCRAKTESLISPRLLEKMIVTHKKNTETPDSQIDLSYIINDDTLLNTLREILTDVRTKFFNDLFQNPDIFLKDDAALGRGLEFLADTEFKKSEHKNFVEKLSEALYNFKDKEVFKNMIKSRTEITKKEVNKEEMDEDEKVTSSGEEITLRFQDSQLYEVFKIIMNKSGKNAQ